MPRDFVPLLCLDTSFVRAGEDRLAPIYLLLTISRFFHNEENIFGRCDVRLPVCRCAGNASQAGHDEHNHELEAHDHEHEGEDHDHDHEGHEHEGHDHEHEAGGTHPDEIVFKKALAEAVGLQTVTVNPALSRM